MTHRQTHHVVLILGSAPQAVACRDWCLTPDVTIMALNNAWRLRDDWDFLVVPEDFPADRRPTAIGPLQQIVEADAFVPANNRYGGILYAGGTMAFTAAYWALHALQPRVLALFGCDMIYSASGQSHFYGQGSADPLRDDISLRSLEARSARLMLHASVQGCACFRLSSGPSRLVVPSASLADLARAQRPHHPGGIFDEIKQREAELNYTVPSGRYWEEPDRFDVAALDALDRLWLRAASEYSGIQPRRFHAAE